MLKIVIDDDKPTAEEMADLLEYIASQLRDGMTSGFYPHWRLEGDEQLADQDESVDSKP